VRSWDLPLKIPLMAMVSPPVANQQDCYCNTPCHVSSCPVQPKTRSCANKARFARISHQFAACEVVWWGGVVSCEHTALSRPVGNSEAESGDPHCRAPCVAFRGHIQEVLSHLPSSSTLRSFAELAVSSLVKYSLETMPRLLI
jgi:hypothetical protein